MASTQLPLSQPGETDTPVYNRAAIIAAITDFYGFMIQLPHVSPADLLYPPPGGWPSITASNFAPLKKSNEAIELLKHLPYLKSSPIQNRGEENIIAWDTKPIDYREERFQEGRISEGVEVFSLHKYEFPEWVIPLTRGVDLYGIWLMLDTIDGTASDYRGDSAPEEKYKPNDPRRWRNYCEGRTMKLEDFLAEWKNRFMSLEWVCLPRDRFQLWWEQNANQEELKELKEMREIFRSNSWPDNFDREACKAALDKWDDSRHSRP